MELFFWGFLTALLIVNIILHLVVVGIDREFKERNNQCDKSDQSGE